MTRGTAYFVTANRVITHDEFNGDMYPDGLGDEFLKALKQCKTTPDFYLAMERFNDENFEYDDFEVNEIDYAIDRQTEDEIIIDFKNGYFDRFFSDWTFWKNHSGKIIRFKLADSNKEILLRDGDVIRFEFGNLEDKKNDK